MLLYAANPDRSGRGIDSFHCRFRCCSFAAAAAAISLSSTIVDAPAVAADRSTTVVAAIDPEF